MIEIYGKPNCPYCELAIHLCEERKLNYKYWSLDRDYTKEELLEAFPGARTVPQIIVGGNKVGGYENLVKYLEETGYNGTGATL